MVDTGSDQSDNVGLPRQAQNGGVGNTGRSHPPGQCHPDCGGNGQPVGVDNATSCPPTPLAPRIRAAPLDENDFLLIRQAVARRKTIRNAARTALGSSVTMLLIGVSALPLVFLWPSWAGVLVTVGLCIISVVEYRGYQRMRKGDPSAARFLGRNQLALLGLIVVYCVIQMATFSTEQIKDSALSPEVRSQMASLPSMDKAINGTIDRLAPLVTYGFYGLVIVLGGMFQGGLAAYYFTRRRRLEAFRSQTPQWIQRLFIETGA